ncbi:MAG: hypothetical protein ACPGPB_00310 [Flavobacteriaceae bacterium]
MIGILICSCHKDDDYLESQNVENSNFENSNGAKKLENPYTVENMRIALENIKKNSNNKQLSNLEIVTSHYYIKFMPETEEQESIIKRDTTMILSDYPLDWEFTDEYLDNRPQLLEGEFPEYWVAVPIDKILPNEVPFEILEELYIPEQDPLFDDESENSEMGYTQKNKINNNVDLLKNLLNEAYTLTGNEGDLNEKKSDTQTNWIFGSKWYASGTLKIWDDNAGTSIVRTRVFSHWEYYDCNEDGPGEPSEPGMQAYSSRVEEELCRVAIYRYINNTVQGKYVPLVGAQVLIRQWFTVRQGITDHNGYFRTGSVRGRARYILQWERYHYSIRNGSLFQAETRGPKVKKQAWNLNIRGGDDEYHGMIHTAAHIYYYGSRFGLTSPPTNGLLKRQMKIAAREINGGSTGSSYSHFRNDLTLGLLAQIHIKAWGRSSDKVFGTTIHELAHAAHSVVDRGSYDNLVRDGWIIWWQGGAVKHNNRRCLETWASTVEIAFALNRYRDHFGQPDYEYTLLPNGFHLRNRQNQTIAYDNHYTSAGWDMIDNINQRTHLDFGNGSTAYPIDRVSGYTIKQLEDALRGARSWWQWRDNIKNRYHNSTEQYLDELFNNWPN